MRTYAGSFFLFLLSHPSSVIFRSTSGRLQSKNLSLDLWSLAKQECFSCKDTTNETVQSDFPFDSFDSFVSFFSFDSFDKSFTMNMTLYIGTGLQRFVYKDKTFFRISH